MPEGTIIYIETAGMYQCTYCGAYAKAETSIQHFSTCMRKKEEDDDTLLDEQQPYRFRQYYIPKRMMPGIRRYIDHGIKPGDFLTAVFENNLTEALGRADDENLKNIQAYAAYMYNEAPIACRGSKKIVESWITSKKREREKKDIKNKEG